MLRYKLSLILFLICYCHFGFSWPDGGIKDRNTAKPKCTHGGILNGVFLHGGLKSRNDTIFSNIPNMQACISKCCKVDKCDLAMMIGSVCHAVKCQDEDSCQISNSKKQGSSLKAQISFITKGEDIKEVPGLQKKKKEPISMATNPQLQEDPEIRTGDANQPKLKTKLNSLDPASLFSSERILGASSNDFDSASGSDESGDESEANWTPESESKPAKMEDYFGLKEESSGEESSGEKNNAVEKTGDENRREESSGEKNSAVEKTGDENRGEGSSGEKNSAVENTGDENRGEESSGEKNSAVEKTGDENRGEESSGEKNSAVEKTGDENRGEESSREKNSAVEKKGDENRGEESSEEKNSAVEKTGDENRGEESSGEKNSAVEKTGDENRGEESSGEKNSAVEKTGDENSGDDNGGAENSGSGDAISADGKVNSHQPELDVLAKPSAGRSAIPTPRNVKFIRDGDSSASFDSEPVGKSDKSSLALSEKHDNGVYDDYTDDSGSASGINTSELKNASGNEEIENSGVQEAGKSTKDDNRSKHVVMTAVRARRPSATPIKTSIPTKLASNSIVKIDAKKPSSSSHKNRGSKSDSSAKINEKLKLKTVKHTQKQHNTKLSRKEQHKSRNIKKSSKSDKNKKDQKNQSLRALASARRKAMPLEDLGSEGEDTDSLSLASAESVNSKIEDTHNKVTKDFTDISRGHIIEKPSSKIEKESLAFIGKSELQDTKGNTDSKTRKSISKLQYQLSNLLAKDSEHTVNTKNAQKMSKLPNKGNAKRQKLFDKIRRIQREREKERHYTQAMKKTMSDNPSPLSIIFMRETEGKTLKYLVHQFSDWRGWKRDELLRPQEDLRCRRGVTIRGATLKGGMLAGDFETVGMVNNQQTCIKACCGNRRCDVALMLGKECFNVKCYSENLCGLAPATTLFDAVTPVITYVRGHISKRSIDYDDFNDDIIESVRKQDAELIRRLEYLTE